jgi:hypothetical protein
MLTGERAFKGDDITECSRKSSTRARLREAAGEHPARPAPTADALPEQGSETALRDIGEANPARRNRGEPRIGHRGQAARRRPQSRCPVLPWIVAAASLAAAGYGWTARAPPASASPNRPARLQIALPAGIDLYSVVGSAMSLSPDGSNSHLSGQGELRQVFLRQLDSFEVAGCGTSGAVRGVLADGKELLFGASDTSLRRLRLSDGFIVLVAKGSSDYLGSWFPDGRIVYGGGGRIWITGATPDAPPRKLTEPTSGSTAVEAYPAVVPGTDAIVFAFGRPEGSTVLVLKC